MRLEITVRCLAVLLLCLLACGLCAQPEIDVQRDGVSIADGGADSVGNTGTSPFNLTYTVRNDGSLDLNLAGMPPVAISGETNCSVSLLLAPASPVAPAGATSFTLQVTPLTPATFTFDISIPNDDLDENPYSFSFTGYPYLAPAPTGGSGSSDSDNCSSSHAPGPGLVTLAGLLALACMALRAARRRV